MGRKKTMEELQRAISLYNIGYWVCLGFSIFFLGISILLFFRFDVRKIFDLRTGRGERKTIQKMEEMNAKTGKLREEPFSYSRSLKKSPFSGSLDKSGVRHVPEAIIPPVTEKVVSKTEGMSGKQNNEYMRSSRQKVFQNEGSEDTTILPGGTQETTLYQGTGEVFRESGQTVMMSQDTSLLERQEEETTILETQQPAAGKFVVERNIIWIHTDEVI